MLGIYRAEFEVNKVALALDEEAETFRSEQLCARRGSEVVGARDISTRRPTHARQAGVDQELEAKNTCHLKRNN